MSAQELSPAQESELLTDLEAMRVELTMLIADEAGLTGTVVLDQSAMGRVSRIDAMQQQEMAKANRRRAEQRLERIGAALDRAEDGEYGYCPDCGEPIGYLRLKAIPDSVFCVPCLQRRE